MTEDMKVDVEAPKELVLPYISSAAVAGTVPRNGDCGISGGQFYIYTDGGWISVGP